MWRGLNWNKIIFLGIFVAVVSMLATVSFVFELSSRGYAPVWQTQPSTQTVLEQNYPEAVTKILQKYLLVGKSLSAADLTNLNNELLAVKVPAKYQQLHWQLIKNLDLLTTATSSQVKAATRTELSALEQQYTWLSKTLAQLLLAIN